MIYNYEIYFFKIKNIYKFGNFEAFILITFIGYILNLYSRHLTLNQLEPLNGESMRKAQGIYGDALCLSGANAGRSGDL